jgi:hypothetical protein
MKDGIVDHCNVKSYSAQSSPRAALALSETDREIVDPLRQRQGG